MRLADQFAHTARGSDAFREIGTWSAHDATSSLAMYAAYAMLLSPLFVQSAAHCETVELVRPPFALLARYLTQIPRNCSVAAQSVSDAGTARRILSQVDAGVLIQWRAD